MLIYFTVYISEFSVQRTLFNQPTEAYLKAKNVSLTVFNIHAWSDLAIVVCLVLDIYVQNQKILWEDEGRDFNGIPFIILNTKVLHCQHGKDRKASAKMKAKETKAEYYVDVL